MGLKTGRGGRRSQGKARGYSAVLPKCGPASPLKGHLSTKSNAFCIDSCRSLTGQYLIRDHMVFHYNRILTAKAAVDCSVPKSRLSSIKLADQQRREKLKKKKGKCEGKTSVCETASQSCSRDNERLPPSCCRKGFCTVEDNLFPCTGHAQCPSKARSPLGDHCVAHSCPVKHAKKCSQNVSGASHSSGCTSRPLSKYSGLSCSHSIDSLVNVGCSQRCQGNNPKVNSGDLLERHSEYFTKNRKPFTPRTLISNAKPLLSDYRYYTPARRKKKNHRKQHMEAQTQTDIISFPSRDKACTRKVMCEDQKSPSKAEAKKSTPDESERGTKCCQCCRLRDTSRHPQKKSSLRDSKSLEAEEEELLYLTFIEDVTNAILRLGLFSNRVLDQLFECYIEENKDLLDEGKMRQMLDVLKSDLGCCQDSDTDLSHECCCPDCEAERICAGLDRKKKLSHAGLDSETERIRAGLDKKTKLSHAGLDRETERIRAGMDRKTKLDHAGLDRKTELSHAGLDSETKRIRAGMDRKTKLDHAGLDSETELSHAGLDSETKLDHAGMDRKTKLVCGGLDSETDLSHAGLDSETKLDHAGLDRKTKLVCGGLDSETDLSHAGLDSETKLDHAGLDRKTKLVCGGLDSETDLSHAGLDSETERICAGLDRKTKLDHAGLDRKTKLDHAGLDRKTKLDHEGLESETERIRAGLDRKTKRVHAGLDSDTELSHAGLDRKTKLVHPGLDSETELVCEGLDSETELSHACLDSETELKTASREVSESLDLQESDTMEDLKFTSKGQRLRKPTKSEEFNLLQKPNKGESLSYSQRSRETQSREDFSDDSIESMDAGTESDYCGVEYEEHSDISPTCEAALNSIACDSDLEVSKELDELEENLADALRISHNYS